MTGTRTQSPASIFTARLLGGCGAPNRLPPLLPGMNSMTRGKNVPTTGTRLSIMNQPDYPRSCNRWTPICTLTTRNPTPNIPMRITPRATDTASVMLAIIHSPKATVIKLNGHAR